MRDKTFLAACFWLHMSFLLLFIVLPFSSTPIFRRKIFFFAPKHGWQAMMLVCIKQHLSNN